MVQINRMGSFSKTKQMGNKNAPNQSQTANLAFKGGATDGTKAVKKFPGFKKIAELFGSSVKKAFGGIKKFLGKIGGIIKNLFSSKNPPTKP